MPQGDSYTSGTLLPPTATGAYAAWASNEEGYVCGSDMSQHPHFLLAQRYVAERLLVPDYLFAHERDCFYLRNHCHIENRRGARFIRPSLCAKFMLKTGTALIAEQLQPGNPKQLWMPTYHGTAPDNVMSILQNGLRVPGSVLSTGAVVPTTNGSALGLGVYTSIMPLYAQLYAPIEEWNGKFYQTFFMLCQSPDTITKQGCSGAATRGLMGRNDVFKLYGGHVSESETQFMTTNTADMVFSALLIKVHDVDPRAPGGEFHDVVRVLEQIDRDTAAANVGAAAAPAVSARR